MVRVGNSELEIFPLGLGGNTFGAANDLEQSMQVLDAFTAAGGNFIDTADSYSFWVPGNSGGESESIIGEWMRKRRNRNAVIIATKVGDHPGFKGLSPRNIARAADASLRRLQADHIDVYYAHRDDHSVPLIETLAAFQKLVDAGKVRYVAMSNYSPERVEEWMTTARDNGLALPVAMQPHYNLVHRHDYEQGLAPLAEKYSLAVFPYFGLASGFLTGKYRGESDLEGRRRAGAVSRYLTADGMSVLEALDEIAAAKDAPVSAVALAWLLARPTVTAPLASATSVEQLSELVKAVKLELSGEDVARLDEASSAYA